MLSYAHGTAAYPLLAETIGADLEASVARSPDALALVSVHQDLRFSYAEFNAAVDALAGGMLGAGLERGDRVGIWSPNRAEWAIVQYATAKLGLILVNINPSCRTHELSYALAQSGARWLFAASEYRGSDFTAMVDAVRPELPDLERVVFFGQP
ncbi:MAG: AMP-binding protein, partial [Solirubrobacterales bacterium]|nr:AMP-binding protein [Solirubrobacterales bacterium]